MPIALPLTANGSSKTGSEKSVNEPELRQFGGYELVEKIARGGMGVVYKARDTRANRIIALKMLLGGHFAGEAEMKRFRTEAAVVASLDHPNIVPLYEVGEADHHPFFTMKFIEGGSLAEKVSKERFKFDQRESARIIAKVARAIHHAHQRGVLHRDLKPANILLDAKGEPVVTDFGIARLLEDDSTLTVTGAIMGTPNYMSPEQAAGKTRDVTTATDIYSLGAILFHLLAGKPPFEAETPSEIMRLVLEKEPERPTTVDCKVDRDLETICLKCLEKEPQHRYASASALADDLERWLRNETIIARRATPSERIVKWVRRKPVVAALLTAIAVSVLVGIVGVVLQWREAEMARRFAEQQRVIAEKAQHQAEAMLTRIELENADLQLSQGNSGGGLAYFARVLRRHPTNAIAAARVMSFLRRPVVALPEKLATGTSGRVIDTALSPDQSRAAIAIDQEADNVKLWNLSDDISKGTSLTHPFELRLLGVSAGAEANLPPFASMMGFPKSGMGGRPGRMSAIMNIFPVSVRFSADGEWLITASNTGKIRVWDAETGQPVTEFLEHGDTVLEAHIAPDRKTLVSIGRMGVLRVWDLAKGELLRSFQTSRRLARGIISADCRHLLTVAVFGVVELWDVETGKAIIESLNISEPLKSIAMSENGESAVAAIGNLAYVWQSLREKAATTTLDHPEAVTAMVLSKDGKILATGCEDQLVYLWNVESGKKLMTIRHPEPISSAIFSENGKWLATLAKDNIVRLWDTASGHAVCEPLAQPGLVLSVQFTTKGDGLIVLCRDGSIYRYTMVNSSAAVVPLLSKISTENNASSLTQAARVTAGVFSPEGSQLLIATGGTAQLWDSKTVTPLNREFQHGSPVVQMAFSSNGKFLLTVGEDHSVKIWDRISGSLIGKPLQHSYRIFSANFTKDNERVVALTISGLGPVWNFRTGEMIAKAHDKESLQKAILSPDEKTVLATLGMARAVCLYDLATGEIAGSFMKHGETLGVCGFSPDGMRVITASSDNTARIWDARTTKPLTEPLRHDGVVYLGAFSPDGKWAVTVSHDKKARIWNVTDGASLAHTLLHSTAVRYAEFSRDSQRLLVVADDSSVHLWDVQLGQRLVDPLYVGTKPVAHFSPDGKTVFITDEEGAAQLWFVPSWPMPAPAWLADLAELIGGQHIDEKGMTQPAARTDLAKLRKIVSASSAEDFYATQVKRLFGK